MEEFEKLLCECRNAVERFVKFRLPSSFDADDVLQEVYISASKNFHKLNDKSVFKAWLIGIARNKCNDYYRKQAKSMEIPIDEVSENELTYGRMGITETNFVRETLDKLADKDKQILYLFYFRDVPQNEIAKWLNIPVGTVKSRLHTAKQNFKSKYPYQPKTKGEFNMKKLPEFMPEYTITKTDKKPFEVKWEEIMGWFIVPKLNEKLSWAIYDMPEKKQTERFDMEVVGKAEVHGIEGVEIIAKSDVQRTFVAQLTDTHCRYLAESHMRNGVKCCFTFLDGNSFIENWGFGEDSCGNETHIKEKGDIIRSGNNVTSSDKDFLLDIVGRYEVKIAGKCYDTICVMDIETYNNGVVSEQYLDKKGRTILWRRFNRNDWAFDRYKQKWAEKLPNNERLTINGETYVHWYDCITDYIL